MYKLYKPIHMLEGSMNVIIATNAPYPSHSLQPFRCKYVMEYQPDYSVTLVPDHLVTEVSPVYHSV